MTRMPAIYDCQFIYCPWHLFSRNCSTWMSFAFHAICSGRSHRVLAVGCWRHPSVFCRLSRRFDSSWEYEINQTILLQTFNIINNNNNNNNNGNDTSPFRMRRTQHSHTDSARMRRLLYSFIYSSLSNGKIIKCKLFTQIHFVRSHGCRRKLLLLSLLPTE